MPNIWMLYKIKHSYKTPEGNALLHLFLILMSLGYKFIQHSFTGQDINDRT